MSRYDGGDSSLVQIIGISGNQLNRVTIPRPADITNIVIDLSHSHRSTLDANARRRAKIKDALDYLEIIRASPIRSVCRLRVKV
jgi:hypothetical protein